MLDAPGSLLVASTSMTSSILLIIQQTSFWARLVGKLETHATVARQLVSLSLLDSILAFGPYSNLSQAT